MRNSLLRKVLIDRIDEIDVEIDAAMARNDLIRHQALTERLMECKLITVLLNIEI